MWMLNLYFPVKKMHNGHTNLLSQETKQKELAHTVNIAYRKLLYKYIEEKNSNGPRSACLLEFKYSTVILMLLFNIWSLGDKLLKKEVTESFTVSPSHLGYLYKHSTVS